MDRPIHVFVYGTMRRADGAAGLLDRCERVGPAVVTGTLFDLDAYPALVLAGRDDVQGEVWRCAPDVLARLDRYERVEDGLFRRVGVRAGGHACWTYVAGPALVRRLVPDRRIAAGEWPPPARSGA